MNKSPLQEARYRYQPKLPTSLRGRLANARIEYGAPTESVDNQSELKQLFRHTYGKPIATFTAGDGDEAPPTKPVSVGVVLSGGQAPGGHNVIAGLFDALNALNPDSRLFGFLGGPGGILEDNAIEITPSFVD
ncbi:MAG: diphosphate--fructose-6-phosphate 1-phosphotransferase, partial [Spirochaetota bacterium]